MVDFPSMTFPIAVPSPTGADYRGVPVDFGGVGGIANVLLGQYDKVKEIQYNDALRDFRIGAINQLQANQAAGANPVEIPPHGVPAGEEPGNNPSRPTTPDASYFSRVAQAESGGDLNAGNPTLPNGQKASSASGPNQFTQETWNGLSNKYPQLKLTPDGLNDPVQNQRAMVALTSENAAALKANGIAPTNPNLYAAHFLGAPDAIKFLKSIGKNPNAPASSLVSQASVDANPTVFNGPDGNPVSAVDLYRRFARKMDGGDGQQPQGAQVAPPLQAAQAGGSQPTQDRSAIYDPSLANMVPPKYLQPGGGGPGKYVRDLHDSARFYGAIGLTKDADGFLKQAEQVATALQKASEPTPKMKEAVSSGQPNALEYDLQLEARKPTPAMRDYSSDHLPDESMAAYQARVAGLAQSAKGNVESFQKDYDAIQKLGAASYNGAQKAELARSLLDKPGFYSGPLQPTVQMYQQFKAIFGEDPTSALAPEAFNKVVNDMLREQVAALGGSGVGRVLQSEVNIMKQSIASLGITPASNRALIEVTSRTYKQMQDLAQISRSVPHSDPSTMRQQLDARVAQYFQAHPLFTKEELQDPRIVAAPSAPQNIKTVEQARAWAARLGYRTGDPIRVNGKIQAVP